MGQLIVPRVKIGSANNSSAIETESLVCTSACIAVFFSCASKNESAFLFTASVRASLSTVKSGGSP